MYQNFCYNCGNSKLVVKTEIVEEMSPINGLSFKYPRRQAFCSKCNNPVYTYENADYNNLEQQAAYTIAKIKGEL